MLKAIVIVTAFIPVLKALQTKIVSKEIEGVAPCMLQCVGFDYLTWTKSFNSWVKTNVDISKCGFTTRPIVFANIEATRCREDSNESISEVKEKSFTYSVFLSVCNDRNIADFATNHWAISWIALGYNC